MIAKGCTQEKYWSYMRRLQPICNAICKSAVWMVPELKRHVRNIKEVWDHQGLACFAYMVCSVGLNFGAGFHLDKEDDGHALWGVFGEVEIAFPECNTVFRVRDGATLSFDARQYYHACVAMAESRQENCVFSLWNSAEQRASALLMLFRVKAGLVVVCGRGGVVVRGRGGVVARAKDGGEHHSSSVRF